MQAVAVVTAIHVQGACTHSKFKKGVQAHVQGEPPGLVDKPLRLLHAKDFHPRHWLQEMGCMSGALALQACNVFVVLVYVCLLLLLFPAYYL